MDGKFLVLLMLWFSGLVYAHPADEWGGPPLAIENPTLRLLAMDSPNMLFETTLRNLGSHALTIYGISSPQASRSLMVRMVKILGNEEEQPVGVLRLEGGVAINLVAPAYKVLLERVKPDKTRPIGIVDVALDLGKWPPLHIFFTAPTSLKPLVGEQQKVQPNPRNPSTKQSPNPGVMSGEATYLTNPYPNQVQHGGGAHKADDEPTGVY